MSDKPIIFGTSDRKYKCHYCEQEIKEKTKHVTVLNKFRFHEACWESKKKELKQKHGLI